MSALMFGDVWSAEYRIVTQPETQTWHIRRLDDRAYTKTKNMANDEDYKEYMHLKAMWRSSRKMFNACCARHAYDAEYLRDTVIYYER